MRARTILLSVLLGTAGPARAGMTVYDLNDVVRLRLEDISFFTVLLLLCGLGIRFLWNYVAKDFPRWPRLTYAKALCLTGLLSLLMFLLVIGAAGLGREVSWLAESHQPLRVERGTRVADMMMLEMAFSSAFKESNGDLNRLRAAMLDPKTKMTMRWASVWDRYHASLFADGEGKFVGAIFLPIDFAARERSGFVVIEQDTSVDFDAITNLPSVIARLEAAATNSANANP